VFATFGYENGAANTRGLGGAERPLENGRHFITEEERRLANRLVDPRSAESLLENRSIALSAVRRA
jgi:hypothetical protein